MKAIFAFVSINYCHETYAHRHYAGDQRSDHCPPAA
jgi:hypothetical protein